MELVEELNGVAEKDIERMLARPSGIAFPPQNKLRCACMNPDTLRGAERHSRVPDCPAEVLEVAEVAIQLKEHDE